MRAVQDFDSSIRTALVKECDGISASEELKSRIDETIRKRQEENSMKHMSAKKLCISIAAACLLVSGITVFAGGASYFVSGSSMGVEYTDYQDMGKAQKKLGYAVDSVEQFANGYSFYGANVESITAYSEENGALYSVPMMNIRYRKDEKKIDLNISEKTGDNIPSKEPNATRICGDIALRYDEYTDKIVPDSYELTEEDKINEQRDDYNIVYMSVTVNQEETDGTKSEETVTGMDDINMSDSDDVKKGSYVISEDGSVTLTTHGTQDNDNYVISGTYDEVCIQHRMVVSWEKDGKSYNMTGTDLDMSAEEMLDMAEEILTAE
ncbi:MAG: hypothetical protein HDR06_01445 [Lachnospiraceae bacterium]|nr:hypothetical protein [Lachnospiraceae bacterium]